MPLTKFESQYAAGADELLVPVGLGIPCVSLNNGVNRDQKLTLTVVVVLFRVCPLVAVAFAAFFEVDEMPAVVTVVMFAVSEVVTVVLAAPLEVHEVAPVAMVVSFEFCETVLVVPAVAFPAFELEALVAAEDLWVCGVLAVTCIVSFQVSQSSWSLARCSTYHLSYSFC